MKDYGALELYGNNRNKYILYYSGHKTKSINGVGIIVAANRNVIFEPISDRICKITTQINILRIAKRVPVEHPRFAGENN